MDSLLRIGGFARLGRVTVKTLRHYADEGLLQPIRVDPKTGYRYYEPRQLRNLNLILNLREAGLGLADIRAVITEGSSPTATGAALEARKAALLAEKALIERRIRLVDALARAVLADREGILSQVRLRVVAPQLAHTLRANVPCLGEPVTELFERAEATVAALSARAHVSPFLLFHDPDPKAADIDLEVCIPVTKANALARVVPGDDLCCSVTYAGSYTQTDPIRARLRAWLENASLVRCGPVREVYHRFGAALDGYDLPSDMLASTPDDYVTEVQIAVVPIRTSTKDDLQ
jgi:DNA-binding transcriptional MerR regulator/effector-binding domain-containing protein